MSLSILCLRVVSVYANLTVFFMLAPLSSLCSMGQMEGGEGLGSIAHLGEPDFSLCWHVSNLTFVYASLVQSMPPGQGTRRGRGHGSFRAV